MRRPIHRPVSRNLLSLEKPGGWVPGSVDHRMPAHAGNLCLWQDDPSSFHLGGHSPGFPYWQQDVCIFYDTHVSVMTQ